MLIDDVTEQELKALKLASENAVYYSDMERMEEDYEHDYLGIMQGRDGKKYAWYFDGPHESVVEVETLEEIDKDKIEKLLC